MFEILEPRPMNRVTSGSGPRKEGKLWKQLQKLGRQINSNGSLLTRLAVISEYAEEIIGPSGNASGSFNFLRRIASTKSAFTPQQPPTARATGDMLDR